MRVLLGAGLALALASSGALADTMNLAGSLWMCTRAKDRSQFIIKFYPGGGVGGGEFQSGEVSPYVFDASGMKDDQWPGRWEQKDRQFTWDFPDQHMQVTGTIVPEGRRRTRLAGTETSSGASSPVNCDMRSKLPRIGEGLVIPKDGHFMDLEDAEGVLKVPTGISLQGPRPAR